MSLKPDNERSGNVDLRNSPILLTDYAREGNTLCSAHLKSSSSAHKDFTCTLGGLIVVYMLGQPEVYALTAGHAWLDNPTTTPEVSPLVDIIIFEWRIPAFQTYCLN